jgi:hypothetical protein
VFNPSGSLRGDVKRDGHVVGVVPDIRHPGVDDVGPLIYAPVAQHTLPFARLIVAALASRRWRETSACRLAEWIPRSCQTR